VDHGVNVVLVVGKTAYNLPPLHLGLGCAIHSLETVESFHLFIVFEELRLFGGVGEEEENDRGHADGWNALSKIVSNSVRSTSKHTA